MNGVRVCCFERPPSVYQLGADGRAVLVSGRDLGPVEVGVGDGRFAKLAPGWYSIRDDERYLRALWITFRGSRMWAEKIR